MLLWLGGCLLARLAIFTWLFAVNVPFSDQWPLLSLLFDGLQWADIPRAFVWQHGPPRLGVAFALTTPMYHLTGWNIRVDAAWITCTLVAAGFLALRLRRALIPSAWTLWDAVLLLAFWSLNVFETIVITPLNAHSIFPLFLVMLVANVWLFEASWRRTALLVLLTVFAGFTGFGLTLLPALGLLVLLRACREPEHWRQMLPLFLGVAGTASLFAIGYRFDPAVDGFVPWQPNPLTYVRFGVAMFNYFFSFFHPEIPRSAYPMGLLFGALVAWVSVRSIGGLAQRSAIRSIDDTRFMEVCVLLCGTTLAFVALTAYGRAHLGVQAAHAPRYMALILPAFMAVHLWLHRQSTDATRPLAVALLCLLCLRLIPETYVAVDRSLYYSNLKLCWLQSYEPDRDWAQANARVLEADREKLFAPLWMGSPEAWSYMAGHRLGPFNPRARVTALDVFYTNPCERLR